MSPYIHRSPLVSFSLLQSLSASLSLFLFFSKNDLSFQRFLISLCSCICIVFLIISISHHSITFVITDEPTITHRNAQSLQFTQQFTLDIIMHSVGLVSLNVSLVDSLNGGYCNYVFLSLNKKYKTIKKNKKKSRFCWEIISVAYIYFHLKNRFDVLGHSYTD